MPSSRPLAQLIVAANGCVDIIEIKNADLDAQLVAENIAMQIERRISFRRAMKKAMQSSIDACAMGIKVQVSGRLGGSEIART